MVADKGDLFPSLTAADPAELELIRKTLKTCLGRVERLREALSSADCDLYEAILKAEISGHDPELRLAVALRVVASARHKLDVAARDENSGITVIAAELRELATSLCRSPEQREEERRQASSGIRFRPLERVSNTLN
ncbi:MAG: hypothetical protein QOH81_2838 [Sphingomonadales bacterium]|nr:hypothetical protein [Sphingomonadales bacterium]